MAAVLSGHRGEGLLVIDWGCLFADSLFSFRHAFVSNMAANLYTYYHSTSLYQIITFS